MKSGSKLLINEYPLMILPSLAEKLGVPEAFFLQQLHYWLEKSRHEKEGHYWVYNTYDDWKEQFPFYSISTIRRAIRSLEDQGIIITGAFNKMKLDKTKWYRIDYDALDQVNSPCVQNEQSKASKRTAEVSSLNRAIPEITTEITSDTSTTAEEPSNLTREQKEMQMLKSKNAIRFIEEDLSIRLSPIDYQNIGFYSDDFGGQEEIINYAGMIASERNAKSWGFIKTLLNEWLKNKCASLEDVMLYEKNKYAKKKNYSKKNDKNDVFGEMRKKLGVANGE